MLRPCRSSQGHSTVRPSRDGPKDLEWHIWTHSKSLAARNGRGTAWARDAMCKSAFNRRLERRVESLGIAGVFHVKYQPFWISREPVSWPWCNLAANQRRPYCASMNSHCPVGLVSRQWDAVDWACVLCDRRIYNDRASRSASLRQCVCPFYSFRTGGFFGGVAKHHIFQVCHLPAHLCLPGLPAFPKAKIAVEREEICDCDGHTIHKLSERRLTAYWLAPRESDCSRLHSKISSDWLPSYIKATRLVLEIFKMAGYFPDSPHSRSVPTLLTLVSLITFSFYHLQVLGAGDILNSWNKLYDNRSGFILGFFPRWYVVKQVIAFIFK